MRSLTGVVLASAVGACAQMDGAESPALPLLPPAQAVDTATWTGQAVSASIVGATGREIGTLTLRPGQDGVVVRIMVRENGLAPGWHGAHFHQVGDCSDIGAFENSQGHVHLLEGGHGFLNPRGPEDGDLPNLYATDAGSVAAEFYTDLVAMSDLNDADGSALVIHATEDDHISQPIGGAGDRVGCAVVPR